MRHGAAQCPPVSSPKWKSLSTLNLSLHSFPEQILRVLFHSRSFEHFLLQMSHRFHSSYCIVIASTHSEESHKKCEIARTKKNRNEKKCRKLIYIFVSYLSEMKSSHSALIKKKKKKKREEKGARHILVLCDNALVYLHSTASRSSSR